MRNINDFIASFKNPNNKTGKRTAPARSNSFELKISNIPKVLTELKSQQITKLNDTARLLSFRCQSVDMPGASAETTVRFTNGPVRQIPIGVTFQTLNVELIEDQTYAIRQFFDNWLKAIHAGGQNSQNAYRIPFYNDICVDKMTLTVYDDESKKARVYTFHEVYPSAINPSQMSWQTNDQNVIIPIEFTFHRWSSTS